MSSRHATAPRAAQAGWKRPTSQSPGDTRAAHPVGGWAARSTRWQSPAPAPPHRAVGRGGLRVVPGTIGSTRIPTAGHASIGGGVASAQLVDGGDPRGSDVPVGLCSRVDPAECTMRS
jgi:hypothetical protein